MKILCKNSCVFENEHFSFPTQTLPLPLHQVPLPGGPRGHVHPPRQHQRLLRAHHRLLGRVRVRQIRRIQLRGELCNNWAKIFHIFTQKIWENSLPNFQLKESNFGVSYATGGLKYFIFLQFTQKLRENLLPNFQLKESNFGVS